MQSGLALLIKVKDACHESKLAGCQLLDFTAPEGVEVGSVRNFWVLNEASMPSQTGHVHGELSQEVIEAFSQRLEGNTRLPSSLPAFLLDESVTLMTTWLVDEDDDDEENDDEADEDDEETQGYPDGGGDDDDNDGGGSSHYRKRKRVADDDEGPTSCEMFASANDQAAAGTQDSQATTLSTPNPDPEEPEAAPALDFSPPALMDVDDEPRGTGAPVGVNQGPASGGKSPVQQMAPPVAGRVLPAWIQRNQASAATAAPASRNQPVAVAKPKTKRRECGELYTLTSKQNNRQMRKHKYRGADCPGGGPQGGKYSLS